MNIQFLNRGKSGEENNITPNIFMQEAEPETKEGIWLKANKPVDKIIFDKNIVEGGNWDTINEYPDLPINIREGVSYCRVGDVCIQI